VLDADGTVVETNQAFHTITGLGVDGMPYGPPHPWWPTDTDDPEDAATVRAAFEQLLARGRGQFVLPVRRGPERRRMICEATIESVGEGARRRFVGTVRDITELRRIAERDRLLADTGRLLGHPAPLPELLDELVRAAVPVLGGLVAVLLTGPDGRQSVAAAAHRRSRARAGIVRAMGVVPPLDERLRDHFDRGTAFVAPPGTCTVAAELARHDRAAARRVDHRCRCCSDPGSSAPSSCATRPRARTRPTSPPPRSWAAASPWPSRPAAPPTGSGGCTSSPRPWPRRARSPSPPGWSPAGWST
jgi:PAS domain S-box-containing protein